MKIHRILAAICLSIVGFSRTATAQQPTPRRDTIPLRADYRDLSELLSHLPTVAPRPLDEPLALWLGALPLSCLDRLQSRPGGRGGGRANAATDSTRTRPAVDSTTAAPTRGSPAPPAPAPANTGAGYFWAASYTLMNDHDRLRAFW